MSHEKGLQIYFRLTLILAHSLSFVGSKEFKEPTCEKLPNKFLPVFICRQENVCMSYILVQKLWLFHLSLQKFSKTFFVPLSINFLVISESLGNMLKSNFAKSWHENTKEISWHVLPWK